jgi:hypothetical protein
MQRQQCQVLLYGLQCFGQGLQALPILWPQFDPAAHFSSPCSL